MRVLMLGWDFPPMIAGGLGTACRGLTRALSKTGTDVLFVIPRRFQTDLAVPIRVVETGDGPSEKDTAEGGPSHVASPPAESPPRPPAPQQWAERVAGKVPAAGATQPEPGSTERLSPPLLSAHSAVRLIEVDALLQPYLRPEDLRPVSQSETAQWLQPPAQTAWPLPGRPAATQGGAGPWPVAASPSPHHPPPAWSHRRNGAERARDDLFAEVDRFAHLATQAVTGESFDVIHAHDWMTFPAAIAIANMTGRPMVAHIHSTEFDRSGLHVHQRIYDIERAGMERAAAVIAVSYMTRGILMGRYGVPVRKISVIYNAIDADSSPGINTAPPPIAGTEKIVLFLGRITMQKGPEYFLAAARKVLEVYDNVRFVMAGSGDMIRSTMELAHDMGIGHKVIFTGFLRGDDVERIFRSADLYVMPSVSEPFGIASLEAISYDVPVLMSKQSGASEVLRHVLKVDFWDIEEMANKIVAVLRHPPLHATLKAQASYEVRRLSWADSARRCIDIYRAVAVETKPARQEQAVRPSGAAKQPGTKREAQL